MFIFILAILCVVLYYYGTRPFSYWSDRNVRHNKPIPFFGNNFYNYMQRISQAEVATALYRQFPDEPFVGFYKGFTPELHVRDPDIIRQILTVDFKHFYARGLGRDPTVEPMLDNLFHLDGDGWKLLRQRLTPAFTSGKLKGMFPLIVECTEQLQLLAEQISDNDEPYDVRELMARFTTDFIGACGFGVKMNSINDSSSKFRELGKEMFTIRFGTAIKMCLKELFPNTFHYVKPFEQAVEDSIVSLVSTIAEQRNYAPSGRNDFIDLMLELRNQGKIVTESMEKVENGSPKIVERDMDVMAMAAQSFVFFAAGFETSSSATSYTLHQLAYNPEVQVTAQKEIDRVLSKYGNKLCYDAVKEMTYLDCTLKEGLRMFPSLGVLNRTCTKKYQIPGTKIWIDKGVNVIIPVEALQHDDKYYENPAEFDPSRFLPDAATRERHKFVYLPFGEGPRACIGSRLGQMQSLAGLAALLQRFSVEPAPSGAGGRRHVVVDPRSNVVQSILGGLPLLLKKRLK